MPNPPETRRSPGNSSRATSTTTITNKPPRTAKPERLRFKRTANHCQICSTDLWRTESIAAGICLACSLVVVA